MLTPICKISNDDVKMFLRVYYNEEANSQRGHSFIEMSDGFGLLHLLLSLNYVYIERESYYGNIRTPFNAKVRRLLPLAVPW